MSQFVLNFTRKYYLHLLVFVTILLLDFFTKLWAVDALNHKIINLIGNTLRFQLVYNTGGAFGIFQGHPNIFHALTGFAIIFFVIYLIKSPYQSSVFKWSVCLILSGAIGNFIDRFFRIGVVDFIDMGIGALRWPTYNVADASISVGACLLIIAFYLEDIHGTV